MYTLDDIINNIKDSQIAFINRVVQHDGLKDALSELVTHQALFSKSVARISQTLVTESSNAVREFTSVQKD